MTQPRAAPVIRRKASDAVVESLRADIAAGVLPDGAKLPTEKQLAEGFGVSQPTVREAVRALEAIGLLKSRHGSGVYVHAGTQDFVASSLEFLLQMQDLHILEIWDVRRALAAYSARVASEQTDDDKIEYMERALERLAAAPSMQAIGAAVVDFQTGFSAAVDNPLLTTLERFLNRITMQLQLLAYRDMSLEWWRSRVGEFDDHRRRTVALLKARDHEGVMTAWTAYMDAAYIRFRDDPKLSDLRLSDEASVRALSEIVLTATPTPMELRRPQRRARSRATGPSPSLG